jgi:hypothetical protein
MFILSTIARIVLAMFGFGSDGGASVMQQLKTLAECMQQRAIGLDRLIELTNLDSRVVEAIVANRYTPSPQQRRLLAEALGVTHEEIAWGHHAPISHVYGHGPQFGRSP